MLGEIHPIAWSIIDPEFRNTFADWSNVSKVAERNAPDADVDPGFRAFIFKRLKPFMIEVRFPYFDHLNVLYPIRYNLPRGVVKKSIPVLSPFLVPVFMLVQRWSIRSR
jgi:hypothetical protein